MKVIIKELEKFAHSKKIKNGSRLIKQLRGYGEDCETYNRLGLNKIGYEMVKDLYNQYGEDAVKSFIDFENETISSFKAKFILVNGKLF